ncbi:MAG: tetratricopeptide repeat protein [Pseudomonadota bacterium]
MNPANAAEYETAEDYALLPPYCVVKMERKASAADEMWRQQMGHDNWIHMHHYCGGLIELNRYFAGTKGRRKASLGNAVKEFEYVLDRWTTGFYLRADAHLNRGRAYKYIREEGKALTDFQRARELNPRLAPASLELADLYVRLNKKNEALTILKGAIELNPDTKSLRRRYAELGGDPKALPEVGAPPTGSAVPAIAPERKGSPAPDAAPLKQESMATSADKPPAQPIEPTIGSPTNPYCRFCPD